MTTLEEVMQGLEIFKKYDCSEIAAEHDEIHAGPSLYVETLKVSDEDAKTLEELGWHQNEEYDCWSKFV